MDKIPTHKVKGVAFSTYTTDGIRKLSVVEVTNPVSFNELGHPVANGLYDARLGPTDRMEVCVTCGCSSTLCNGHFGHIELPLPVYSCAFLDTTVKLLRCICLKCNHVRALPHECILLCYQLQALHYGFIEMADDMAKCVKISVCNNEQLNEVSICVIQSMLKKMLNEALHDSGDEKASKWKTMIKSVVKYRNELIKGFIAQATKNSCIRCKARSGKLKLEFKARIAVGPCASVKGDDEKHSRKRVLNFDDCEKEPDDTTLPQSKLRQDEDTWTYITPLQAREHLRQACKNEPDLMEGLVGSLLLTDDASNQAPTDGLFLDVLPVPPSRFRPISKTGDEKYEHCQSSFLRQVVEDCILIRHLLASIKSDETKMPDEIQKAIQHISGSGLLEKLQSAWFTLQNHSNIVFDSSQDKIQRRDADGIKQLMEKKSGLFRMHMMGKRVNYAARSVISPDPYINVDEIGIPDVFARKLTYPQPVTSWNIKELRQAVINGPDMHPGATMVQNEDGTFVKLGFHRVQREAIAKQLLTPSVDSAVTGCKIVYRHLQNGDMLLINRQPTLHKPSIMAHKACILYGEKTLRLNYSNCKTYNADFDGDEMNCHFPQGEVARSEAYTLASVNNQYLVPKDGTPLGGLIQDHIVSGALLMTRGNFFGRDDYQQLVFGALTNKTNRIVLLKPAIVYPCQLWSGKQIVSTVIINTIPHGQTLLSMNGKSKVSEKSWQTAPKSPSILNRIAVMCESEVIIRNGELMCGILDKAHCGPTSFGLIHCCYELYGGEISGLLLSRLGRLFTHYLQIEGFSLGVHDIMITSEADRKRKRIIKSGRKVGYAVVSDVFGVVERNEETLKERVAKAHLDRDDRDMKQLDLGMKMRTDDLNNQINNALMPAGLLKKFPQNNLQLMVVSGAKGAMVNCMQISCLLGQIELEGRRPPLMISGKSLPSFLPYDFSPRAGGFVDGRFLTGIRPQEFFFHCMAGREGLIDTAVKTSRSGYLQRCLVKHLEGLTVAYDLSVRDSDGSIIQFQYGEDSLDIVKIPFLNKEQLSTLVENADLKRHVDEVNQFGNQDFYNYILKKNKKIRRYLKHKQRDKSQRASPFLKFSQEYMQQRPTELPSLVRRAAIQLWHSMNEEERARYKVKRRTLDPVTSYYRPDVTMGAISEKMDRVFEDYLEESAEVVRSTALSLQQKRAILHHKFMKSLCEPGEAVGLLAAQSIGEPSTQMTLNTFHFAGRGEMNVTLGIPRLQEILMFAAAKIATPSMEVPFLNVADLEVRAEVLRKRFSSISLADVLEKITISETIDINASGNSRRYKIFFQFLPHKDYKKEFYLMPSHILRFVERIFFKRLTVAVIKQEQLLMKSSLINNAVLRTSEEKGTSVAADGQYEGNEDGDDVADENGNNDESEGDEGDARLERLKMQSEDYDISERLDNKRLPDEDADGDLGSEEKTEAAHEKSNELDDDDDDDDDSNVFTDEADSGEDDELQAPEWEQEAATEDRIKSVLAVHHLISDYVYDKKHRWCEVTIMMRLDNCRVDLMTLIRREAKKAIVHCVPGIRKAFVMDVKNSNEKVLKTDGVNMQEMFLYNDILDLPRLYSNSIHEMAKTYGIEAANRAIVKEIKDVFSVYGIKVDLRHLLLIADYMTFDGVYRPLSRYGLKNSASPLQQMTFETTMTFLRQATVMGFPDCIKSPSARLIVGQEVGCGTGCFSLVQPFAL